MSVARLSSRRSLSVAAYPAVLLVVATTTLIGACTSAPSCVQNVDYKYVDSQPTINVPIHPTALDGGVWGVWVASSSEDALWHVSAEGSINGPYLLGGSPSAVVEGYTCAHGDRPWVALSDQGTVVDVDGQNKRVLHSIPVGKDPVALAESKTTLWVANAGSDSITRIDKSSASVTATIPVGHDPRSLAFDFSNFLYVANHGDNTISVIDDRSATVVNTIQVGRGPISVAYGIGIPALNSSDESIPDKLWVADFESKTVDRIDPGTNKVTRNWSLTTSPISVMPYFDQAWVLEADNTMIALDDSTKHNLGQPTASVGNQPVAAILRDTADLLQEWDVIWVASSGTPTLTRVGGVIRNGCGLDLPTCSG